jgi:hypothetical protein
MRKTLFVFLFLISLIEVFSQTHTIYRVVDNNNGLIEESFYSESINLTDLGIGGNSLEVNIKITKTKQLREAVDFEVDDKQIDYSVFWGRNILYLNVSIPLINQNNGRYEQVEEFSVEITEQTPKSYRQLDYPDNSVLNSGKWVKIGVTQRGAHKITYAELQSLGFSNPSNVRVFGNDIGKLSHWNNVEVPTDLVENFIFRGSDFIVFFAEAPELWEYDEQTELFERTKNVYCDTAYYFLTDKNTGFLNAIPTLSQATQTPTATISKYTHYDVYETDTINIIKTGRIWLGESFLYDQNKLITLNTPSISAADSSKIIFYLASRSPVTSSMQCSFAGETKTVFFSPVTGTYYNKYVDYKKSVFKFAHSSPSLQVSMSYNKPTASAEAWIDKIIVNTISHLSYSRQMTFRSIENVGANKISRFQMNNANNNVQIWDVTNPTRPQKVNYSISGSTISFNLPTETIREFVVFESSNCYSPIFEGDGLGQIENQNLHNMSLNTDMLIITPPCFLSQANQYAQIHRQYDKLNVVVVTTEQIYNEFGSGMRGAPQIRNYIRMVYDKTEKRLNYVLLFGNGTYNNKGKTTPYNPNYIPTYQTFNSFNIGGISTVTDDFYALLDEDEGEYIGKLDIAVGRMPIKSSTEADDMIAKLRSYYNPESFGDWHNIVTLVADDRDKSFDNFVDQSERLADKINDNMPFVNIKKIYLDAYQQQNSAHGQVYPDAVLELNNRINNGTLIVNYIGHGSPTALATERIVTRNTIRSWSNFERLSLFITGTCEFSRFDNALPDEDATSAGESVILSPNGGAIVMLTTARVSYAGTNLTLNDNFYEYLFAQESGKHLTIGDAYYKAKNLMNNNYNALFFTYLGSPAIRLQYPINKVHTSTINGKPVESFDDTLRALDKVVLEGFISDENNNLLSDFDGIVNLTYFDKKRDMTTLNNDGHGAMDFWCQYNGLFRGRASVSNGLFSISFIIPKDIYYNFGRSKFSYYATNNFTNATGNYNEVVLGGINPDAGIDDEGPEIRLYMNDSTFVVGGITNSSPAIYAILTDESGINTSSASIGHDISAILNNSPNKTYSLNEYYQTDIDDFKQGSVSYGLYLLDEGSHTVSLKAWDVHNNPSEKTISFVVIESNDLTINKLLNYPNPFTTNTNFFFEHNKPGMYLEVLLQIFTVSGKLVKTIHQPMTTAGFRSEPINWNGLDDFGSPIGRGVYIYKLKIRTPEGDIAEEYEKLLILK